MKMIIDFEKPQGATIKDVAEFVLDILSWGGGCRHPDDPMFHSIKNIKSIKVHGKMFVPEKEDDQRNA